MLQNDRDLTHWQVAHRRFLDCCLSSIDSPSGLHLCSIADAKETGKKAKPAVRNVDRGLFHLLDEYRSITRYTMARLRILRSQHCAVSARRQNYQRAEVQGQ
jgi:hypothetical protein